MEEALNDVGEAIAGAAQDIIDPTTVLQDQGLQDVGEALTEAASDVVPPNVIETLKAFFATDFGMTVARGLVVVLILLIGMIIVKIINRAFARSVRKLKDARSPNASVMAFLRYVVVAGAYFVIFSSVVAVVPVLSSILTTLLATGGVLALVAGVAAQEALGSIASGVMILVFKPFIIGDVLRVPSLDITGTVEDITLRHTVLKTVENKCVIIPNSTMNGAVVENFDYGEKRVCLMLDIGITYESDTEKALAILAEEVAAHPDYLDTRTPEQKAEDKPLVTVRVQELADSAVILRALLWGVDNGIAFGMRCDLLRSLKARFDKEGISFAYPHIHIVQE